MNKFLVTCLLMAFGATSAFARYRGDLNGDDRVDLADMVALAKAIQNGSQDSRHDIDVSGAVDENDLEKLADLIINGTLTEDSGFNVGIGGWEDSGEDFGGTVNAPRLNAGSAEDTRLYVNHPKATGQPGIYSVEFGVADVADADDMPCGVLFDIVLPYELNVDAEDCIELVQSIGSTHKLYGKPVVIEEGDEWYKEKRLRFIVFSSSVSQMRSDDGAVGRIKYNCGEIEGYVEFRNCQIVGNDGESVAYLPGHGFWIKLWEVMVNSVILNPSEISLLEGDGFDINAVIEPWDASDLTLKWETSDSNVVEIINSNDNFASCKAISPGSAVISAVASNGVMAICDVKVLPIPIESIKLNVDRLDLEVGDTFQFIATVEPSNATHQELTWSVDDESVANITPDGFLTVTGEGTTTVRVRSAYDQGMEASVPLNAKMDVAGLAADEGPLDVYTPDGVLVKRGSSMRELDDLGSGIYLLVQGSRRIKMIR